MKRLIFQVAVGETPPFYDICINSAANYARTIRADHIVLREPQLKIIPTKSQRSENALRLGYLPIFEKEYAFNYLDQYDQIAIIDADIYIKENSPNIFDQLDGCTFAAVAERDMPLTAQYIKKIKGYSEGQYSSLTDVNWKWSNTHGAEFFNMGLMLFDKDIKQYLGNDTPEQFIKRKEFERFVNGEGKWRWSTDQTLLNYWVKKSGMKVKNLDWKWNALFKGIDDSKLPESYFIHFFLSGNLPQKGMEIPQIVHNLHNISHIQGHK